MCWFPDHPSLACKILDSVFILILDIPTTVHTMRDTTVGIVSIGDMGLGMAKLLQSHGYRVVTVGEGRRYDSSLESRLSSLIDPQSC